MTADRPPQDGEACCEICREIGGPHGVPSPPAAVAARPAGEEEGPSSGAGVREEIARAIFDRGRADNGTGSIARAEMLADAVLATPALRRAIAERDEARAAVERVRTVLAKAERDAEQSSARMFDGRPFPPSVWHEDLRRALDGDEP